MAKATGKPRSRANPEQPLSEQVYERMRTDILRCVLPPGEQLTEAELAERYGLGKAPVRTALTRLRHDGLVQSTPRRGWAVTPLTLRDARELFQIRLILEPQVARLAAGRIDEERLRRLDELVQRGYQPGDPESQAAFLEANREFHLAIAEASGNARLIRMVNSCMEEIGRLLHIGLATDDYGDKYQHEHRELIQALIEGDADAAESITYAAIRGGEEMVLQALLETSTLVDVPAPLARSPRAASSRP